MNVIYLIMRTVTYMDKDDTFVLEAHSNKDKAELRLKMLEAKEGYIMDCGCCKKRHSLLEQEVQS